MTVFASQVLFTACWLVPLMFAWHLHTMNRARSQEQEHHEHQAHAKDTDHQ